MALARIRTHFPEEVSELREALVEAGYVVETIRPDEFRIAPADLELTVEKLPVVEAWRRIPDADSVYVSPETPESQDIRSALGVEISREPLLARLIVETGERYTEFSRWAVQQARELRARLHEVRQQWTPPREYEAPVHLDPVAPSSLEHSNQPRIDAAIEQARLEVLRRNEELRRQEEAEKERLAKQARVMEENRRRAREASEAKALLMEQQKIEAMVRATEALRERVVHANIPAPHDVPRQVPRHLLRTRRERAFARAGIVALVFSASLAVLAGEVLHPQPASSVIPRTTASASTMPFAKRQNTTPAVVQSQNALQKPPSAMPSFAAAPMTVASPEATTASLKPPASKPSAARRMTADGMIAEDEVIVRKPTVAHHTVSKPKTSIVHYSDLD